MITEQNIADEIKKIMDIKKISAYKLEKNTDLNKQQIYSVLRMGKSLRPDYQISTLLKILNALQVESIKIN